MLRALLPHSVSVRLGYILDAPIPVDTSDDHAETSPTSPLVSPSVGPRSTAAALQMPLTLEPQRVGQILAEQARAHFSGRLVIQSPTGDNLSVDPQLFTLFAWLSIFCAANIEACRQGATVYVASAKAKRIAHGSVGATGDFGFNDLYDGKKSLAECRRMIGEPLRAVRRLLKGMSTVQMAEIDPATLYVHLHPSQLDFLCRVGVLMQHVLQVTPAFTDLVHSTPSSAARVVPQPLALSLPRASPSSPPPRAGSPMRSPLAAAQPAAKLREVPPHDASVGDTGITHLAPALEDIAPAPAPADGGESGQILKLLSIIQSTVASTSVTVNEMADLQEEHMGDSHETLVLAKQINSNLVAHIDTYTRDQQVKSARQEAKKRERDAERKATRDREEMDRRDREAERKAALDREEADRLEREVEFAQLSERIHDGNQHLLGAMQQGQRAHTGIHGTGGGGSTALGSISRGDGTGHGARVAGGVAAALSRARKTDAASAAAAATGVIARRATGAATAKPTALVSKVASEKKAAVDVKKPLVSKVKAEAEAKAKPEAAKAKAKAEAKTKAGDRLRFVSRTRAPAAPVATSERSAAAIGLTAALGALPVRAVVAPTPFPTTPMTPAPSAAPSASPDSIVSQLYHALMHPGDGVIESSSPLDERLW